MSGKYSVSVGDRFGKFVVVRRVSGRYPYLVVCDCGVKLKKDARSLHNAKNKMCLACSRIQVPMNKRSAKEPGHSARTQLYLRMSSQAKDRGIDFMISREDFALLTSQECYYCGAPPGNVFRKTNITSGDYVYNGLDRVDSLGIYEINNVVPCCKRCNQGKNDMTQKDFYEWICKVYANI